MVHDSYLPDGLRPGGLSTVERQGVLYGAAAWTPNDLERLAAVLRKRGAPALREITDAALLAAWAATVGAFRDRRSTERQRLDPALSRLCGLSRPGLDAALEAVLGGVDGEQAARLAEEVGESAVPDPVLIILSSNLPALAVQPLLPALLLRRPVILKSPSAEPLFAPAFLGALARREPLLADAMAAITWKGGDRALEAPLLANVGLVVAYGEEATLRDLEGRVGGRLLGYGPRTSLAAIGRGVDATEVAAGLARDVALFDQRGCLSIQAIYCAGNALALARRLSEELRALARRWPPGPPDPVTAAGVQQLRSEALMRGLYLSDLPLRAGTVVVDPEPRFRPSPGLRSVRIHPLPELAALPALLTDWRTRLQGAALAGADAWELESALAALDLSRFATPGELQSPDALWHNGGLHPLEAMSC